MFPVQANPPVQAWTDTDRRRCSPTNTFTLQEERREEGCDGPRIHPRPSAVAFFRGHHATNDGGELMREVETSAKEKRLKKLDTVWQVSVKKKTSHIMQVELPYASEVFIPVLGLGMNNRLT